MGEFAPRREAAQSMIGSKSPNPPNQAEGRPDLLGVSHMARCSVCWLLEQRRSSRFCGPRQIKASRVGEPFARTSVEHVEVPVRSKRGTSAGQVEQSPPLSSS